MSMSDGCENESLIQLSGGLLSQDSCAAASNCRHQSMDTQREKMTAGLRFSASQLLFIPLVEKAGGHLFIVMCNQSLSWQRLHSHQPGRRKLVLRQEAFRQRVLKLGCVCLT